MKERAMVKSVRKCKIEMGRVKSELEKETYNKPKN
ncbi:hypothetical protein GvMRE_I2g163 [endosymbiont GvMRE of Glomus versiforme]|nr:hypothetical protein GvMRE_I2g163 [endosymbiont GvMRE of Glomus versiforme]